MADVICYCVSCGRELRKPQHKVGAINFCEDRGLICAMQLRDRLAQDFEHHTALYEETMEYIIRIQTHAHP